MADTLLYKSSEDGTNVIRAWLIVLSLMVYAMILIGGATRLTDSGLSITEWAPIHGTLPPFTEAAWNAEFDKYRQTAEYQLQNVGMSMGEFQYIYWWEWGHRLFGRLIGLVAIAGFAFFLWRGWLTRTLGWKLVGLIALGGLQGAIGWWMVASGIGETTRVDVAPYRLAVHFTLALIIIGIIAWLWMDLGSRARAPVNSALRWTAYVLLVLVTAQMATGALVAGLDAGRTYTDWPLMAGEAFPQNYIDPGLGARSLFEGREATQFNHRGLAYLLFGLSIAALWAFRRSEEAASLALLATLITLQSAWGILTLLNAAPMSLALVHQGLGVIVFLVSVKLAWRVSAYRPSAFTTFTSGSGSTNTT